MSKTRAAEVDAPIELKYCLIVSLIGWSLGCPGGFKSSRYSYPENIRIMRTRSNNDIIVIKFAIAS